MDREAGASREVAANSVEPVQGDAQKRPRRFVAPSNIVLAAGFILAICAGMVNVISRIVLGTYVSHVSGTVTAIGWKAQGWAEDDNGGSEFFTPLGLWLSFIGGAMLCGLFAGRNDLNEVKIGNKIYGGALIGNAGLLVLVVILHNEPVAKYLAAAACGLQNGLCTMHLGAICRTTHVTGLSTDLGTHWGRLIATMIRSRCWKKVDCFDRAETRLVTTKLKIFHLLGFGFLFGAFLGAFFASWMDEVAFVVPASISAALGIFYIPARNYLKQAHEKHEGIRSLNSKRVSDVDAMLEQTQSLLDQFNRQKPDNQELDSLHELLGLVQDSVKRRFHTIDTYNQGM